MKGAAPTSGGTGPSWPQSSLLGRLTHTDRDAFLSLGTRAVFPERRFLIRQGGREDHVVLLTKGLVKVVVNTETGHEALLAVRAGGDLVGEMAVLERKPRSASVVACVPTSARLIPAESFRSFLNQNPNILYQATRMLSERLRSSDEQRVAIGTLSARARVARILAEIVQTYGRPARDGGWELGIPLRHSELASLAGVRLSSVEKSLRWMQESGAVTRRSRGIVIADQLVLRQLAGLLTPNP